MMGNWAIWWWVAAGVLVAAELVTGTFYLLMLALGAVVGALVAHTHVALVWQIVAAAGVGLSATALWHFKRSREEDLEPVEMNRNVHIDIGQIVQVPVWHGGNTATVMYRGSRWNVRCQKLPGGAMPLPGPHVIVGVQGNQLQVAPPGPNTGSMPPQT